MELFSTFVVKPEEEEAFLPLLPSDYKSHQQDSFLIGAATQEGIAVGVLWLERIGIRLHLLHMETAEEYRKQGVASQLLDDFYWTISHSSTYIPVTASFAIDSSTQAFRSLMIGRREVVLSLQGNAYTVTPGTRLLSKNYQKIADKPIKATRFWDCSEQDQRTFFSSLSADEKLYLGNIPREDFCRELCFCCGNPMRAAIFLTRDGEKDVELSYLVIKDKHNGPQDLQRLLMASAQALDEFYPLSDLHIYTEDPKIRQLLYKLFPKGVIEQKRYRADWISYKDLERSGSV